MYLFDFFKKELLDLKELLIKKNYKLSASESCTGGLLGGILTSIPNSSLFFEASIVVYSNVQKVNILGINKDILNKYGAVSEQCSFEMAKCVKKISGSDIAISITGIAGPSGGSKEKPVGTVFSTIFINEYYKNFRYNFYGSRNIIRIATVDAVLSNLLKLLRR